MEELLLKQLSTNYIVVFRIRYSSKPRLSRSTSTMQALGGWASFAPQTVQRLTFSVQQNYLRQSG